MCKPNNNSIETDKTSSTAGELKQRRKKEDTTSNSQDGKLSPASELTFIIPTSTATTKQKQTQESTHIHKQTTLYASISLALLVAAITIPMPHAQSRRDELQCTTLCLGTMTSLRSTLTLIGSAIMGRLSDTQYLGRRNCLFIGIFATAFGLVIAAMTKSIEGMIWSMVPGALLQQNFSIFKALLADLYQGCNDDGNKDDTDDAGKRAKETTNDDGANKSTKAMNREKSSSLRSASVGKLGMSVGLAFMVGPLTGATLLKSYEHTLWAALILTFSSGIIIGKIPFPNQHVTANNNKPTVNTSDEKKNMIHTPVTSNKNQILQMVTQLIDIKSARSKPALLLILIRTCMALAFHIFNTIWTASLKNRFNFGPKDHGMFMSFIGLIYALSQGFVAQRVLRPLGQQGRIKCLLTCCIALGLGRYVAFQVQSLPLVYIMFTFVISALGIVNTILTADTSLIAPSSELGGLYGVLDASQSAAGMVGPLLGGYVSLIHPVHAPLMTVVGLYFIVFVLVGLGYDALIYKRQRDETFVKDSERKKCV